MHLEFHRAARFPFATRCEVTDMGSEKLLTAFTSNLSLFGCYVITGSPFPEGTRVSLKIMRGVTTFSGYGKVVYSYLFSASEQLNPKLWAVANRSAFEEWAKQGGIVGGKCEEY